MRKTNLLPLCLACGWILTAGGADWPQWRGPERNGISKEEGLLQEWPEEGPKLVWQQSGLGDGYSTPAVADNRIFLISNQGLDNEYVQALRVRDGKQLWATRIGNVGNPDQRPPYPGARSTPTVDGKMVYALGSDGDLACLDAATGKIHWQKSLRNDFGGKPGTWAYAESPLVDGNVVVVSPGGEEATMLALNKKTGDVVWKSPIEGGEPAGYASIIVIEAVGVKQYVQFLGKGLAGVDAATGKFLWRYDHTAQGSAANIFTPVAAENYVYTGTTYTAGGLVRLTRDADEIKAEEVYYEKKLPTAIGGAVLLDGALYGTNRETTFCVDFKTGDVIWKKDRGMSPASLCYADGRLYLHGDTEGDVGLVEATPGGYRELGHFTPPNIPERQGKSWSYPVVANGRLYIHDWGTLWCYDVKAPVGRRTARTTTPARN